MKAKKSDITHKLKIARGQIDGILQMIESDRYCVDISNQLQATQACEAPINRFYRLISETVSGRPCRPMLKIQNWRKHFSFWRK